MHVHPRVRAHAARLRTLELCLLHTRTDGGGVWRAWSHALHRFIAPVIEEETRAICVHLRVPMRKKPSGTMDMPRSLFVPTMLKNAQTTGAIEGRYSTWGSSYSLLDTEKETAASAWRTLARRGKQLYFAIEAARAAGRLKERENLNVYVLDHVAGGTHAQDPGISPLWSLWP